MKVKLFILVCLASLSLGVLAGDEKNIEEGKKCHIPVKPGMPNGRAATEQEIIKVQRKVKAYIKKGEKYIQCIAALEQAWGENVTPEQKQGIVTLHNGMVDAMESVASAFNSTVRAYKGKKPQ
jgi:hypothetical protein